MINNITMNTAVDDLIKLALKEDITSEDITTNSIIKTPTLGKVDLICKQDGVLAGIDVFKRTFNLLDNVEFECFFEDSAEIKKGDLIAVLTGDIKVLLSAERVALNYLQRMSGIATYTSNVVSLLDGKIKLLDTRKTTPNMRIFEKYSVKVGGGTNHRYNLSDGILLKDNHINAAGSVKNAIELARDYAPFVRKIEVEVETLDMVKEAIDAKADIIMLDNMDYETLEKAIKIIDKKAIIEVSGNITKENISNLINLGVDYISSGALTHSAPILDFSLKNLRRI